jgi:hypothetical protein
MAIFLKFINIFILGCIIFSNHAFAQKSGQLFSEYLLRVDSVSVELEQDYFSPQRNYVRPFITDDARVVGRKYAQVETWVRFDKESGQHWILGAYGPNKKLELTIGGVYGYEVTEQHQKSFSYGLPLLQAKFLFKEYKANDFPGLGLVMGTFLPLGKGSFKPAGYGSFGYLTVSQCFGKKEDILLHLNLGANYLHINKENSLIQTWGLGTQVRVYKGFHFVGELFSGDPYIPGTGTSYQLGYRYFVNDLIQVDMTAGKGISGEKVLPFWLTAGLRLVTERFLKRK